MEFQDRMIKIHGDLLNRELSDNDKEYLGSIIEGIVNIDTIAKRRVFSDLLSCYPELDYEELAKKLKYS